MGSLLENIIPILLAVLSILPTLASYSDSSLLDFTGYMIGVRSTKVPGKVTRVVSPEYCEESVTIPAGNIYVKKTHNTFFVRLTSSEKIIEVEIENSNSRYLVKYSNISCEMYQSPTAVSTIVKLPKGTLNVTQANGKFLEECSGYCSELDNYIDDCKEIIEKEVGKLLNVTEDFCRYS